MLKRRTLISNCLTSLVQVHASKAPLAEAHLQAMFNDFVSREQAVILLDGLDEVSNWRERQEVVRAIELFMTTHVGDTNTQQSALLASSQGSGESDEEQSREEARHTASAATGLPGSSAIGGNQIFITSRVFAIARCRSAEH